MHFELWNLTRVTKLRPPQFFPMSSMIANCRDASITQFGEWSSANVLSKLICIHQDLFKNNQPVKSELEWIGTNSLQIASHFRMFKYCRRAPVTSRICLF